MNTVHISPEPLRVLLQAQKIATMPQLKSALGTSVDGTVFRKLSTLTYRTSYSHRGAYYTLDSIAHYDAHGLWSHNGVYFSKRGTLLDTAAVFVTNAPAGCFIDELESMLHVPVKDALRQLAQAGRLERREFMGRYLYCAAQRARCQEQLALRQAQQSQGSELQAAIVLFYSLLDEQQRRLYAGLESLEHGHGGDRRMAELLGLEAETVARGRREILSGQVQREGIRRAGGGRPQTKKKRLKS